MELREQSCKIRRISSLNGVYSIPPDETLLQRAIWILAQAPGVSKINNIFPYDSVKHTIDCLAALGVDIQIHKNSSIEIHGVGLRGFKKPETTLDIGGSRIGAHLLLGTAATYPFETTIDGSPSFALNFKLKGLQFLHKMGAEVSSEVLPSVIKCSGDCTPGEYVLEHSCSQIKGALLMAGMNIKGATTIVEPFSGSKKHTELLLKNLGANISITSSKLNTRTSIEGMAEIRPQEINLPGDTLSSLFLIAATCLSENSNIVIEGACLEEEKMNTYNILIKMGAKIQIVSSGAISGERSGEIHVQTSNLQGIVIKENEIPMDCFQFFIFLFSVANGKTVIENPKGLKLASSLRLLRFIKTMQKLGAMIELTENALVIEGRTLKGGKIINAQKDYVLGNLLILCSFTSQHPITIYNHSSHWFKLYYKKSEILEPQLCDA